ncbi:uncharacterized protein LOC118280450 isoform X2 [Spodoptera frugiperda]|uniref:Uncharacterized protein LOC118280450 isoform X2 n=1 Tax=Spodoptera frugiperda TaxID=7108 RepID=A0A9R0E2X0_SPOFR|nr:uncharacterized protein LOC118280450 isoform X2 [Spodoptera frugiperda]
MRYKINNSVKVLIFFIISILQCDTTVGVYITFKIEIYEVLGKLRPMCDHDIQDMKSYTVREGENIIIMTNYDKVITDARCYSKYTDYSFGTESQNFYRNESIYKAKKEMGTVWECSITSLKNDLNILFHEILYTKGEDTYARTICTMNIHVRREKAPMVILVNNMQMALKQTQLSDEEADFTAIYHYKVGDKVNITCVTENYNEHDTISMQSPNVGKVTHPDLQSSRRLGIKTTLTSLHDDPLNITINGILMRPQLNNIINNQYTLTYVHKSNSRIDVICETSPNYKLLILNKAFRGIRYYQNELTPEQKINIHFTPSPNKTPNFRCSADNRRNGYVAQACDIMIKSDDKLLNDSKIMEMVLPANRTVLEVSNDTLQVIYYKVDVDEDLEIKCSVGQRQLDVVYMHFQNNHTTDENMISKIVTLKYSSTNPPVICYLRDQVNDVQSLKRDEIMYQIEVIFVNKDVSPRLGGGTAVSPDLTFEPDPTTTIANQETHTSNLVIIFGCISSLVLTITVVGIVYWRKRTQRPKNTSNSEVPTSEPFYGNKMFQNDPNRGIYVLPENNDPKYEKASQAPCNRVKEDNEMTPIPESMYDSCSIENSTIQPNNDVPKSPDCSDPNHHHYEEVNYLQCKPKPSEPQQRSSKIYNVAYDHVRRCRSGK